MKTASQIHVYEDNTGEKIEASVGDTILIHGEAATSSGYLWKIDEQDTRKLKFIDEKHSNTDAVKGIIGSPTKYVFQFLIINTGTCELSIKHLRPWIGDRSISKRVEVTLVIS